MNRAIWRARKPDELLQRKAFVAAKWNTGVVVVGWSSLVREILGLMTAIAGLVLFISIPFLSPQKIIVFGAVFALMFGIFAAVGWLERRSMKRGNHGNGSNDRVR